MGTLTGCRELHGAGEKMNKNRRGKIKVIRKVRMEINHPTSRSKSGKVVESNGLEVVYTL